MDEIIYETVLARNRRSFRNIRDKRVFVCKYGMRMAYGEDKKTRTRPYQNLVHRPFGMY